MSGNEDVARTVKELEHHGKTSHEVYTAGFYGTGWDFIVRSLLGKVARGGADAGEVLATIAGIGPKDHVGWFDAWIALGERVSDIASSSDERGHRVSAARAHLRAATYFAVAVDSIDGLGPETAQLLPAFRAHRAAWEGFVSRTHWPVERVDIPYEGSTMPGWFFRPVATDVPRPTLIAVNGSDGSISGLWCEVAEGALERGYNVLLFDGPGQQSMLFERDVPFRPDWENVLTPVVDFLLQRPDVDAERLAAYGLSQGGYWLPRALAFEHRIAAAVVDGGVVDVARPWLEQIPGPLRALYEKDQKETFDRDMAIGMKLPGGDAVRRTWAFRARPYGAEGYAAVLDAVTQYRLGDLAERITTPLYITDPDGDQFFPGQSAELAERVPGATRVRFTQEEGASGHCQPMARALTEQRTYDWLDERLA
jgi:dienelactone hydrolase